MFAEVGRSWSCVWFGPPVYRSRRLTSPMPGTVELHYHEPVGPSAQLLMHPWVVQQKSESELWYDNDALPLEERSWSIYSRRIVRRFKASFSYSLPKPFFPSSLPSSKMATQYANKTSLETLRDMILHSPAHDPPPGIQSNLIDPPSRSDLSLGIVIPCFVTVTTMTLMRLYVKLFIVKQLHIEDCKILRLILLSFADWIRVDVLFIALVRYPALNMLLVHSTLRSYLKQATMHQHSISRLLRPYFINGTCQ